MEEQIDNAFIKLVQQHNLLDESTLDRLWERQESLHKGGESRTLFAIACEEGLLSPRQQELIGEAIRRALTSGREIRKPGGEAIRGRDGSSGRRVTGDRQRVISADAEAGEFQDVKDRRARRPVHPARYSDRPRPVREHEEAGLQPEEQVPEGGSAAPIRTLVGLIGIVVLIGIVAGVAVFIYLRSSPKEKVDEAKLAYDELMSRLAVEDFGDEEHLKELRAYRRRFPTSEYSAEFDSNIIELKNRIKINEAKKMAQRLKKKVRTADPAELRAIRSEIQEFIKKNLKTKHVPKMIELLKDVERRIRNAELDERWKAFSKPIENVALEDNFGAAFAALEKGNKDFGKLKRFKVLSGFLDKQAKRRYLEIASSARNRATAGDLGGAIEVYKSIAKKFGLPRYVERAYRDIAKLREDEKKPRMKQFADAQAANRKAREKALEGDLEAAIKALRSFANEAADGSANDAKTARGRARVLSDVPTFAAAVAEGINQLVGKRYTVRRVTGVRFTGKVVRADADSFDIKIETRTLTVRWDELEPGIIMRLGVGAYPGAMIDGWPAGIAWLIAKGDFDAARSHLPELQEKVSRVLMTLWLYDWEEDAALYKPARQYLTTKDLETRGKWNIESADRGICEGRGSLTVAKKLNSSYRFKVSLRVLEEGTSFSISIPAGDSGLAWVVEAGGTALVRIAGAKTGKIRSHEWTLAPFEKYDVEVRLHGGKCVAFLDGTEVWSIGAENISKKNRSKIAVRVNNGRLEVNDPVLVEYRTVKVKPKKKR